mgnify:CR=1 FL=1
MSHITVIKDVEVDIDLDDFETEDLAEELSRRGGSAGMSLGTALDILQRERAPRDLIESLRDWDRMPVATETRLKAWKKWAAEP